MYRIIKIRKKVKINKENEYKIRNLAKKIIPLRVKYYSDILNLYPNKIFIRFQRSRWGSCSSNQNLNFNGLLALTPFNVLDSVIIHELCHLKYMNHQKDFWDLVYSVMPEKEYKEARKYLNDHQKELMANIFE